MKTNSKKSFLLSVIAFLLFVISFTLIATMGTTLPAYIIGIGFCLAGIAGIIGWIYGLKSIKEPSSIQKIIGLVFNSLIVIFFVFFILGDLLG